MRIGERYGREPPSESPGTTLSDFARLSLISSYYSGEDSTLRQELTHTWRNNGLLLWYLKKSMWQESTFGRKDLWQEVMKVKTPRKRLKHQGGNGVRPACRNALVSNQIAYVAFGRS